LEEEKKLIIDAEIKICLEKEVCGSPFKVFDQQLIPQPLIKYLKVVHPFPCHREAEVLAVDQTL
jgi:hypothetical protein